MILHVAAIALLVQAAPVSVRVTAAKSSLAGIVVHSGTGEPIANVQVTLARTDAPLGAFAEMIKGDPPPVEMTIPAIVLSAMVQEMAPTFTDGPVDPAEAAEAAAFAALPLSEIHSIIMSPAGSLSVISKSAPPLETDSQGRFTFSDVEPGAYRLMFSHNGYARRDYGQRASAGGGTPIVLVPGQSRTDIVMRMTPAGAIGGRVLDGAGQPVAGVPVRLLRVAYDEQGQQKTSVVVSTQTNDRGDYRIFFVSPGRYYLNAGNELEQNLRGLPGEPGAPVTSEYVSSSRIVQNYGISYYPRATELISASAIDIKPGADIGGINLLLEPQKAFRLRGRITDPGTGQHPPSALISVFARTKDRFGNEAGIGLSEFAPVYNGRDGTFELQNVRPGTYKLIADLPVPASPGGGDPLSRPATAPQNPRASAYVTVVNSDVDDVILPLGSGGSLAARVRIDPSAPGPEPQINLLRVQLKNVSGESPTPPRTGPRAADGTFRINNVLPGQYRLSVTGLPSGFYVKVARLGGVDVLNSLLEFGSADTDSLDIVISPNVGTIDGTATDRGSPWSGAQVVLIPERNRNRPELFRLVTADATGHFSILAVIPGDYRLVAWEVIEPYGFFDPQRIKLAEERGVPIHVAESSNQTIAVVPIVPVDF